MAGIAWAVLAFFVGFASSGYAQKHAGEKRRMIAL
jgi:hypothetical protein